MSPGSSPTVREGSAGFPARAEIRTMVLFWFFWSAYLCLSVILVAALLTDWPAFLHDPNPYLFR